MTPWSCSSAFTFGSTRIDSTVWSSVISTTMFGRLPAGAAAVGVLAGAAPRRPRRPARLASGRRASARPGTAASPVTASVNASATSTAPGRPPLHDRFPTRLMF